jgi:hypothetical protein
LHGGLACSWYNDGKKKIGREVFKIVYQDFRLKELQINK